MTKTKPETGTQRDIPQRTFITRRYNINLPLILPVICFGGAIALAISGHAGWGWFIFAGLVLA